MNVPKLLKALDQEELKEILNDLGLFPRLNAKKFPKLYAQKDDPDSLILFYNGPKDYGLQEFNFQKEDFIYAFQNAKFKHDTPKDDYLTFFDLFFQKSPNPHLATAFFVFSITPTVISKTSKLKGNKRLKLMPKTLALSKVLKLVDVG